MSDRPSTNSHATRSDELFASIEATPIATVVTDPRSSNNPIVAVNHAFCALTGYTIDEVLGRNCRFLGADGVQSDQRSLLRRAIAKGRPALAELINYRKDGTAFLNAVMIAPVLDEHGKVAWFIGSQMDVTDRSAPQLTARRESSSLIATLTQRQLQVLKLMVAGYRNKQIAGSLGISELTVKMHRKNLLAGLGVPTSADAIRIGVEAGLTGSEIDEH